MQVTINPDGSFIYEPFPDGGSIGQQEVFTYKVTGPDGSEDTATLTINIQEADNLTIANDDTGSAVVNSDYLVVSGGPEISDTAPVSGHLWNGTSTSLTQTFSVDTDTMASVEFAVRSPDAGWPTTDTLTLTITGDNGYNQVLTGTSVFLAGLQVNEVLSDLPAGNYTVTASYTRTGGDIVGGTLSLDITGQSITHLDEFVVDGTTPATGNVLFIAANKCFC